MPKVSIIIPNYNHSKFLTKRIRSVLDQTFFDFEVIILDDCSKDESKTVITEYQNHLQVKHIVVNKFNSGSPFKQWQKGLSLAEGELIWIAESDDYADLRFLEEVVEAFDRHKEVGIVKVGSVVINTTGDVLSMEDFAGKSTSPVKGEIFLLERMANRNGIYNASAVVFRKSLAVGQLDEVLTNMKYCGDWLFWSRIVVQTSVLELHKHLNYFRRHLGNVSGKAEQEGRDFTEGILVFREIRRMVNHVWVLSESEKRWASELVTARIPRKAKWLTVKRSMFSIPTFAFLTAYYFLKNRLAGFHKS